jgi:hypothetical protein
MRVALERHSAGAAEFEIGDLENPLVHVQKKMLQLQRLKDHLSPLSLSLSLRSVMHRVKLSTNYVWAIT